MSDRSHAGMLLSFASETGRTWYWYHPHPHGISEGQVQGGATGALIVQGLQNVFPSLANVPTRTLIIRGRD